MRVGTIAMRTRFEIALWGERPETLRAVAEEALAEVRALDAQLSAFDEASDVFELNAIASERPVVVEPRLFRLLERAAELAEGADGAFDITVGPLLRAWGFSGGSGHPARPEELQAARACTGRGMVLLDARDRTVRFAREGVRIDLGAIGKGYALDRAAAILSEAEPGGALLHGGTSSVVAVGAGPDGAPWRVAVADPRAASDRVAVVELHDEALSVSAVRGKAFEHEGMVFGHVLDPRSGEPVRGAELAAVVCHSATDGDALSTALLVRGSEWLADLCREWRARALVVEAGRVVRLGL